MESKNVALYTYMDFWPSRNPSAKWIDFLDLKYRSIIRNAHQRIPHRKIAIVLTQYDEKASMQNQCNVKNS